MKIFKKFKIISSGLALICQLANIFASSTSESSSEIIARILEQNLVDPNNIKADLEELEYLRGCYDESENEEREIAEDLFLSELKKHDDAINNLLHDIDNTALQQITKSTAIKKNLEYLNGKLKKYLDDNWHFDDLIQMRSNSKNSYVSPLDTFANEKESELKNLIQTQKSFPGILLPEVDARTFLKNRSESYKNYIELLDENEKNKGTLTENIDVLIDLENKELQRKKNKLDKNKELLKNINEYLKKPASEENMEKKEAAAKMCSEFCEVLNKEEPWIAEYLQLINEVKNLEVTLSDESESLETAKFNLTKNLQEFINLEKNALNTKLTERKKRNLELLEKKYKKAKIGHNSNSSTALEESEEK